MITKNYVGDTDEETSLKAKFCVCPICKEKVGGYINGSKKVICYSHLAFKKPCRGQGMKATDSTGGQQNDSNAQKFD